MPRIRSKKKDKRSAIEKLEAIDSKVDRLIFFNYYDGIISEGNIGFDVRLGKPGTTQHRKGVFLTMTKSQFRSKGKRMAALASEFIETKVKPPYALRPQISAEEIKELHEAKRDKRSPTEKLQLVSDDKELFIFIKYYQGFKTNGEFGFSPSCGVPGSVNHKRSYANYFSGMDDSKFREKGKELGALAKEFVDQNIEPSSINIAALEDARPSGMIEAAREAGF